MAGSSLMDQADRKSLVDDALTRADRVGVYLMRHGRTALDMEKRSDGWLDLPLSDEGQRQLIDSQQLLKHVPLATIYTPDLKRTKETAELVQSGTPGAKIVVNDDLKTWNLGLLAGTKKRYSRPEVKQLMDNPKAAPPGGEPYGEFMARFLPEFVKVASKAKRSGKSILIICSGSNLRCLGKHFLFNEDAIDLDEGGLACMYETPYGFTGEVIHGGEPSDEAYESA
jgi:broad specificity phosphatase PhoE